ARLVALVTPRTSPVSATSFFFFQAEDGIRDDLVTGVQTCALPILLGKTLEPRPGSLEIARVAADHGCQRALLRADRPAADRRVQIGRASCRERVEMPGGAVALKQKATRARR